MDFSYKRVALYTFNRLQQCGLIQNPCIGYFEKALDVYVSNYYKGEYK